MTVTAIITTRGGLPEETLIEVAAPLACFEAVLIWDNSQRTFDLKLLGGYMAAGEIGTDLVFLQDDDLVQSDPRAIVARWRPGHIIANMPREFQAAYRDKPDCLMGFGSVFEPSLVRSTWARYRNHFPIDALACREAHRIFTGLNRDRVVMVDVPKTNMPYATDDTRLWRQPDHGTMAREAYRRVTQVLASERAEGML